MEIIQTPVHISRQNFGDVLRVNVQRCYYNIQVIVDTSRYVTTCTAVLAQCLHSKDILSTTSHPLTCTMATISLFTFKGYPAHDTIYVILLCIICSTTLYYTSRQRRQNVAAVSPKGWQRSKDILLITSRDYCRTTLGRVPLLVPISPPRQGRRPRANTPPPPYADTARVHTSIISYIPPDNTIFLFLFYPVRSL